MTGFYRMGVPSQFNMENRFTGLNLRDAPENISPHSVLQSDNLINYGGRFYTRPGLQALLTSAFGQAIYEPTAYIRTDGTTVLLLVSGGKLYFQVKDAASTTEIKVGGAGGTSFSLTSANARIWVDGKYAYVVDGAGSLYRVSVAADGTYTAAACTALTAPSAPNPISLTNTTIDAFSSTTGWSADYLPASGVTKTITAAADSGGTIVITTSAAHGLAADDVINITGCVGNTAANGTWRVGTVGSSTTCQLHFMDGSVSASNGAWTSGGTLKRLGTTTVLTDNAGTNLLPQNGLLTSWAQSGGNFVNSGGGGGWTGRNWGGGTLLLGYSGFTAPDGTGSVLGVQLDVTVDGFDLTTPVPNYIIANDASRYARDAYVQIWYGALSLVDSVDVIVNAFSDTAAASLLASRKINFKPKTTGVSTLAGVVSFGDIDTPIRSWTVQYHCPQNVDGTGNQPSVGGLVFYPLAGNGSTATPKGAAFTLSGSVVAVDMKPVDALLLQNTTAYTAYAGGEHLIKDFLANGAAAKTITAATNATPIVITTSAVHGLVDGDVVVIRDAIGNSAANGVFYAKVTSYSTTTFALYSDSGLTSGVAGNGAWISGGTVTKVTAKDFSTTQDVAIQWSAISDYAPVNGAADFSFRVGLRNAAGITYSYPATLSSDGTYYSVDISTMTTAQRQNIGAFEIVPISDLSIINVTTGKALFAMGPLTSGGYLSVNTAETNFADYVYVITEAQDTSVDTSGSSTGITLDGTVESDGSAPSPPLTPTQFAASTTMTLAAFTNSAANYFNVYRFGGPFPQSSDVVATFRLIAKLPRWSDTITTDSIGASYCTWNHTTRVFRDNTPDSALFTIVPTLITGRGAPPTAATCGCSWRGHQVLAKGSTIYASWLMNTDNAAGLYYNSTNDPKDPYGTVKGFQEPVAPNDGDTIVGIRALGQYLVVFKSKRVYVVSGSNPFDLVITEHLKDSGVGLAAGRGLTATGSEIAFLGPNAVYLYDGDERLDEISGLIEPGLSPQQNNQSGISATAYAKIAIVFSGKRLHVFAPVAGGSNNSIDWCYDTRIMAARETPYGYVPGTAYGWTKLLTGNITGACSLAGANDVDEFYLAGGDGQLYKFTGAGDKSTPSQTPATAIAVTLKGRGMCQDADDRTWWQTNRPVRVLAKLKTAESASVTLTCSAQNSSNTSAITHTGVNGAVQLRDRVTSDVRGDAVYVTIALSTITQTEITGVGVEAAQGTIRGNG